MGVRVVIYILKFMLNHTIFLSVTVHNNRHKVNQSLAPHPYIAGKVVVLGKGLVAYALAPHLGKYHKF
jgi:hypothetical protein